MALGSTILKKYSRATAEALASTEYFRNLSAAIPEGLRSQWKTAIEQAEKRRRGNDRTDPTLYEAMDIMKSNVKKRAWSDANSFGISDYGL